MLDSINLMNGMIQKMGYLQTRQRVLSENISNADTPEYKSRDVKAPNFAEALGQAQKTTKAGPFMGLATTNPAHINFGQASNGLKSEASRQTYEITPEGNSVSTEEQMVRASQTAVDYQLMTNLYNKNLDMLRAAMK